MDTTALASTDRTSPYRLRWVVAGVVLAANVMDLLDATIVNVAAPPVHPHPRRRAPARPHHRQRRRAVDPPGPRRRPQHHPVAQRRLHTRVRRLADRRGPPR